MEIFPESPPDKPAGRIVEVLTRNTAPIVGRVRWHGKELRLYPEGQRINRALVLDPARVKSFRSRTRQAIEDGDVVAASLESWADRSAHPIGAPEEFIGRGRDPETEIRLITRSRGFYVEFPQDVSRAANATEIPDPKKMERSRRDLRDMVCFTIDPDTARDFDDALSIRQTPEGFFELGIHIADVSHFVPQGGVIDREAWKRGTSVYLVDTVLPMLPERLSNTLCSLVPDEPRFAMSVLAVLDSSGTVRSVDFFESVIRSRSRFTYRQVEEILGGGAGSFAPELRLLHLVAQVLRRRRDRAGSVDLELSSPQIKLDANGVPVSIRASERLESQRMVEECMLLANRLVAERLLNTRGPGLYRVHPQPRESDVQALLETLRQLGIRYTVTDEFTPDDYRNILAIIENLEFRDFVEAVAAKSLTKAYYTTSNEGHFGLAMDAYTHFTSPIRRYPDLVVHRLLKQRISGRKPSRGIQARLQATCEQANSRERAATDAERAYIRLKALQYLSRRIGREYAGTISGVTSFGLFVEIDRYLVEGLVPIATLGRERFELRRADHTLVGGKTGTAYRLGDRVRITVTGVDTEERRAEFRLARQKG